VDELDFECIVRQDFPFFPLVQGRNVHGAILVHDEDMHELFGTKTIDIYLKATIPLIRRHGRNKDAHYTRVELAEYSADHVGSHLRALRRDSQVPDPPPHEWTIGGHNRYDLNDFFMVGIRRVFPDQNVYWVDLVVPFLLRHLVPRMYLEGLCGYMTNRRNLALDTRWFCVTTSILGAPIDDVRSSVEPTCTYFTLFKTSMYNTMSLISNFECS